LRVQVTAPDNNQSSLLADTIWVTLANSRRGETETLLLTETTDTSGLFRSVSLPTSDTCAVAAGDSLMVVGVGDAVFFTYADPLDAADRRGDTVTGVRRITAADTMRFVTAMLTDTALLFTGDSVSLELADADRNYDPQRPDTVTIPVWNVRRGDTEWLTLTETTDTSGLFRVINGRTVSAFAGFADNDGFLISGDLDTLQLVYVDSGAQPATDTLIAHVREEQALAWLVNGDSVSSETFAIGGRLYVRLTEYDGNRDPYVSETVAVQVTWRGGNDTETIIARENGNASWTFYGTTGMPVSDDTGWAQAQANGILLASDSGLLELVYRDATCLADSAVAFAAARAETGVVALIDEHGADTPAFYLGRHVYCRIVDLDENDHPFLADTIAVTLSSGRDTEYVTLTETAPANGRFAFPEDQFITIAQRMGGQVDDGILWAQSGDTITLRYSDPDGNERPAMYARVLATAGIIWSSDSVGIAIDTTVPGYCVYPWLSDYDGNSCDTAPDTVAVMYLSPARGDTEYVVLTETGDSTGMFGHGSETVFVSWSAAAAAAPDNGLLYACVGDTIWLKLSNREESIDTASDAVRVVAYRGALVITDTTAAVTTLLAFGDSLDARLYNPEGNLSPLAADVLTVTVTCTATQDTEVMLLRETGLTSALFRSVNGGLPLSIVAPLTVGDGVLLATDSGALLVTFDDSATSNEVVTAAATVCHHPAAAAAGAADSGSAGGVWTVWVQDSNANRHPLQAETVTVQVWSQTSHDTETVILTETNDTSGIFAGYARLSDTAGGAAGDGLLMVGGGESLAARYQDAAYATDSAGAAGSMRIMPTPSAMLLADTVCQGAAWQIAVVDTDRNRHPRYPDTLTVSVSSAATGDTELVVLTETADTSGWFSGSGTWLSDTTGGGAHSGLLLIAIGDSVRVQYADTPTANDSTDAVALTTEAQKNGWAATDSAVYALNATGYITVGDSDANFHPLVAETVTVTIWCAATADSETLIITEVLPAAERFRGGIRLSDTDGAAVQDGILVAGAGDTVCFRYVDAKTFADSAVAVAVTAEYFTPARLVCTLDSFAACETVTVVLTDTNANRRPTRRDTVTVTLSVAGTGDTELLTLLETTETSARFTGGVLLSDTTGGMANDGWLLCGRADSIAAAYADARDAHDSAVAQARLRPTPTAGWLTISDSQPYQDSVWTIVVGDSDANCRPRGADTVAVILACPATGDSETVMALETGDTAARFSAVVAFISDTAGGVAGDGLLLAGRNDTVTVWYADPDDGDSAGAMLTVYERRKTAWSMTDNPQMAVGGQAMVVVGDSDANEDPLVPDTLVVTLESMGTGDSETLTCTESGPRSERFVAYVPVSDTAGAGANDGILMARSRDTVTQRYQDADNSSDSCLLVFTVLPVPSVSFIFLSSTGVVAGDSIGITVADTDANADPRVRDTLAVTIYDNETADTEIVLLTETTDTSARFAGSCPVSDTAGGGVADGILLAGQGDSISVRYCEPETAGDSSSAACTVIRTASQLTLTAETA
ncbi:MAG TPA: hypothetical protein PKM88_08805, partial [bacterium]|nr:hypothetical protein [bacterium]